MAETERKRRPLEGVRVIDLTKIVAGPNCTRMLATMGAEVIRLEWHDQRALDLLRMVNPKAPGGDEESLNRSGLFNNINAGKYGATLNLSLPQGRDLLKRLVAKSTVLCENYSPNQMEKWGLGYQELSAVNPRLIYMQITGMGKSGTYNGYLSVGPTAQALSGLTHMSGLPEPMPPAGWGYSYLDHSTGYYGAMLVMAALLKLRRTGKGCYIDVSQTEVGLMTTGTAVPAAQLFGRKTPRLGNRAAETWAPHGAYPCRGADEWIAIAVQTDEHRQALRAEIGDASWAHDARFATAALRKANEDELDSRLAAWTRDHDRYDLMNRLQRRGIPAAAVQNAADRCERDAQLKARGYFVPLPHSEIGTWAVENFPARFGAMPVEVGGLPGRGAPMIGEDNDYVYRELLGLSPEEIATLQEEMVI
ncbi:MAG TPA: CoA transferase [Candidatus Binataceae bacterium]|jgi:crotonobetainyl-CoA:carnitine CoA-transferase CaiB-like acyl-CoA transferase|nr:CoA transferase [Candidatus Binataceae bacterium]